MIAKFEQWTEMELLEQLAASEHRLNEGRRVQDQNPEVLQLPGFHVDMAVECRRIAICRYVLGQPASAVRPLLEAASRHYLALFLLRDLNEESLTRARGEHQDISFFTSDRMFAGVSTALIVNLPTIIQKIAGLPWETYSSLHPAKHGVYHATIAILLDAGLAKNDDALKKSEALWLRAETYDAPPPLLDRLLPAVMAVQAALKLDSEAFHDAMGELLRVHEYQIIAQTGPKNVATLVCFEALVGMAVAIRAGLYPFRINSPFAPQSWIG